MSSASFSIALPADCPCCDPCNLGDTLEVLFSGIVPCVGCVADGTRSQRSFIVNSVSLTGPYTLTKNSSFTWVGTGGSYDIDVYASVADFCDTFIANHTGVFELGITCLAGNLQLAATFTIFDFGGPLQLFGFFGSAVEPAPFLDTAIPNEALCVWTASNLGVASDGTGTISRP